jgi:hypothetical protein
LYSKTTFACERWNVIKHHVHKSFPVRMYEMRANNIIALDIRDSPPFA